jgi:hypothetical protein
VCGVKKKSTAQSTSPMAAKEKPAAWGGATTENKRAGPRALRLLSAVAKFAQRAPRPFQLQEVKGKGHGIIALRNFRKGEKVSMGNDVFMLKGPDEKVSFAI